MTILRGFEERIREGIRRGGNPRFAGNRRESQGIVEPPPEEVRPPESRFPRLDSPATKRISRRLRESWTESGFGIDHGIDPESTVRSWGGQSTVRFCVDSPTTNRLRIPAPNPPKIAITDHPYCGRKRAATWLQELALTKNLSTW